MNERRRKALQVAIDHLDKASSIVQDCASDEQEAHDNLPETIQWTERGDRMEEAISAMEEAVQLIDEASQLVSEAME